MYLPSDRHPRRPKPFVRIYPSYFVVPMLSAQQNGQYAEQQHRAQSLRRRLSTVGSTNNKAHLRTGGIWTRDKREDGVRRPLGFHCTKKECALRPACTLLGVAESFDAGEGVGIHLWVTSAFLERKLRCGELAPVSHTADTASQEKWETPQVAQTGVTLHARKSGLDNPPLPSEEIQEARKRQKL